MVSHDVWHRLRAVNEEADDPGGLQSGGKWAQVKRNRGKLNIFLKVWDNIVIVAGYFAQARRRRMFAAGNFLFCF